MHPKTVLLLGIMMKRCGFLLWWIIGQMYYRSNSRRVAELYMSRHTHKWLGRLPVDLLDDLIQFPTSKAVYGIVSVDLMRHRFNRCVLIDYSRKARDQKAGRDDALEGKR